MSNNKTVTTMSYKEARRLRKQNKLKSSTSDKIFNAIINKNINSSFNISCFIVRLT